MPTIVELEAAHIEAARAGLIAGRGKGQCLIERIKPRAGTFHIHRPGPGAQRTCAPPPGFGQGYGKHDIGGDAAFLCCGKTGGFAQACAHIIGALGNGGACAKQRGNQAKSGADSPVHAQGLAPDRYQALKQVQVYLAFRAQPA